MAKRSLMMWAGVLAAVVVGVLLFLWWDGVFPRESFANEAVLIYYMLPTCGWCQRFNPTWEKLQEKAKKEGVPVTFRKVDGSESAAEVEAKGVQGFPTLRLEVGGKDLEYDGERTEDAILEFVKSHL